MAVIKGDTRIFPRPRRQRNELAAEAVEQAKRDLLGVTGPFDKIWEAIAIVNYTNAGACNFAGYRLRLDAVTSMLYPYAGSPWTGKNLMRVHVPPAARFETASNYGFFADGGMGSSQVNGSGGGAINATRLTLANIDDDGAGGFYLHIGGIDATGAAVAPPTGVYWLRVSAPRNAE